MGNQWRHQPQTEPEAGRRPALRVRLHRTGSDLFVQLTGELCARTIELLRGSVVTALRAVTRPRLALDLSQARLTDRFGLGILVALHHAAGQADGRLILVGPSPDTLALLADTGLDRHLTACHGLELAGTSVPVSTRPAPLLPIRGTGPRALHLGPSPEPTDRQPTPGGAET